MTELPSATSNTASDINRADGCGAVRENASPHLETLRLRMKEMYRSMSTYDIAQLLHVPEAQVYRAVFGTRAASLRQHNRDQHESVPFHLKEPSRG